MSYSERLHVPLRWWVQGTMLVILFWFSVVVAVPRQELVTWTLTGIGLLAMAGAFRSYGATVSVSDGVFRAGPARIGVEHVGAVEVLDREQTRRTSGVDADARAFLVLRPYLKTAVKVEITDPADRTPYWLVHSRNPEALARALVAAASIPGDR